MTPPDALPASKEAEAVGIAEAWTGRSYSGIDTKQVEAVFNVLWPQQEWNGEEGFCRAVAEKVLRTLLLPEVHWGDSGPIPGQNFGDEFLAHPPTDARVSEAATAACDAFDVLSLSEAYGGSGATSVSSKDLAALDRAIHALRAALSTAIPAGDGVPPAIRDIAAERKRQIDAEGWTTAHDDAHSKGEMARAAGIYAVIAGSNLTNYRNATGGYNLGTILGGLMDHYWPWEPTWFKPTDRRRDLVKAGALIVAEIERLDRLSTASGDGVPAGMDGHACPICAILFQPNDICATDIEMGTCHAACLEGSPTVDLETGDPVDGPIPTYPYGGDKP